MDYIGGDDMSEKRKDTGKTLGDEKKTSNQPAMLYKPWSEKRKEIEKILGDEGTIEQQWNQLEVSAYLWLWYLLL